MESSSSKAYHEAGKKHEDTKSYSDEEVLQSKGKKVNKLTRIRVWWSEYMVGFEALYGDVSAGARVGSKFQEGTDSSDFTLGDDEYITEVSGRAGQLIDQITFHTNKGRKQQFGDSTGGEPFSLKEDGKVVVGFTVGFGGNLHFIGAHFGDARGPPKKSSEAGNSHEDTKAFDDYKDHFEGKTDIKLTELKVYHDEKMVFGIEGVYEVGGKSVAPGSHVGSAKNSDTMNQSIKLSDSKYITGISGRAGEVIDGLSIHLSDGTQCNFGGSGGENFDNIVPDGKRVVALGGGLGEHLHTIFCYYQ